MKLLEKPINVVESDSFESVSFGIKQSGLPYIFNILRNQLYSNKPLAVLREVSCNAQILLSILYFHFQLVTAKI